MSEVLALVTQLGSGLEQALIGCLHGHCSGCTVELFWNKLHCNVYFNTFIFQLGIENNVSS